ncbi:MAG: Gfo/Idh/MocA family oxidoreductase, partial [Bacteroidia bacterium]|nr:Gfo/Idh/MocA family oxidoreductase [Bacteroidia bacterium]
MKLALFGYGHLGKIHLQCLKQTPFHIAGIYDPVLSENVIDENIKVYKDVDELINNSDACIIASTTSSHYSLAKLVLEHDKHLFLEKPMTSTIDQSGKLVR